MLQLFTTVCRKNDSTIRAANTLRRDSVAASQYGQYYLLAAFLIAGFLLRIYRLGDLNFWCDEDITALAVKGILQHGYPELPSGMIYLRSLLTTYLSAFFVVLFGFSELALRLPSLLFSLSTGLVVFFLGKKLFSKQVGFVAVAIHVLSFWDVEFARHARMYEAFAFFYSLSLYAIYRSAYCGDRRWNRWSIVFSFCTILVHIIGAVLAVLFIAVAISRSNQPASQRRLFVVAAYLISAAAALFFLIKLGFSVPAFAAMPAFARRVLPFDFPALHEPVYGFRTHFLLIALFLVATLYIANSMRKQGQTGSCWAWSIPVLAFLLLAVQQSLAAIMLLFVFLLMTRNGGKSAAQKLTRLVLVCAVLILCVQALLTVNHLSVENISNTGFINRLWLSIKMMAGFPKIYYLGFLNAFPAMTIIASIGLVLLYRGNKQAGRGYFAVIAFVLPLVANGFLASRFMESRINFYLNPLFIVLFAFTVFEGGKLLNAWIGRKLSGKRQRFLALAIYGCLALLACEQIVPKRLTGIITREYGARIDKLTAPGSHLRFMPDHASPGNFAQENRRTHDIVIVTDWLAQSYYSGQIDFWLRTYNFAHQAFHSEDIFYDVYTGTPIIADLQGLKEQIARCNARRVWLIAALPYENAGFYLSNEILDFLNSQEQNVVFRGRDGVSRVYLFRKTNGNTGHSN